MVLLGGAALAQAPLPKFPKNIPNTVFMPHLFQQPTTTVPPVYPPGARDHWAEGTIVLDAVIGENGQVEMLGCDDYCNAFRPDMIEAAAAAVRQWRWAPILVKGKPVRVRTQLPVQFRLDENAPPVSVCNIIRDPKAFIGKNMNVYGMAKKADMNKLLSASECSDGAITLVDASTVTPPAEDSKYAQFQEAVALGPVPVAVRGLVREDITPGYHPIDELVLERILQVPYK